MKVTQGRVFAPNPDIAAQRVREMHEEYIGELSIRVVPSPRLYWFEYYLTLGGDNGKD